MLSPSPSFGCWIRHLHTSGGMAGYRCSACMYTILGESYKTKRKENTKLCHSRIRVYKKCHNFRWCSSCRPGDWDWPDKTGCWKVSLFKKPVCALTIIVVILIFICSCSDQAGGAQSGHGRFGVDLTRSWVQQLGGRVHWDWNRKWRVIIWVVLRVLSRVIITVII